jgi:cytochrome P450
MTAANHDERHFPDPDRFDIHRKIGRSMTFGYGLHFCMGAALARLEGRVTMDEVLNRFPEWDVDMDKAVRLHNSISRGWESLPVLLP